jgi:hypothetical protein
MVKFRFKNKAQAKLLFMALDRRKSIEPGVSRAPKPETQEKPMVEVRGCVGRDGVPFSAHYPHLTRGARP